MQRTVSDNLIAQLQQWGVERIFGYSGDGINGILGALQRADNTPAYIPVRHEESAALMASGHARFTGKVGVCLATQGPGAIHLLNGLYDARLDHQPVVAIVGQVSQMSKGSHFQQEVDLTTLFKDVAGAFVEMATEAEQVEHLVDRAMRIALSERTVTCIIIPHDLQNEPAVDEPPHEHGAMHSARGYSPPRVIPTDADLARAAEVLNAGNKVAMLVGAGALGATDEVIAVADALGAGVAKALLGKPAVPDDLPFVTGTTGWLGTTPSNRMLAECDTLLMVGSGFPYTEFLPPPGQARGVQIDIAAGALSTRYPMEVGLVGDAAETLSALLPLLKLASDQAWRSTIEGWVGDWHEELDRRAAQPANPVNPQLHYQVISPLLPDDALIAADSGTSTVWYARNLQMRRGMKASVSGTLATMGCALPYAIAAKLAYPDRLALAFVGDGGLQMNGLAELITVAEQWRDWADPRLIIHVLHNRDLGFVTWEQRAMEGSPRFPVSQQVPPFPYARYADLIGLQGIRVDDPSQIAIAWRDALNADRPVVIEAITDPDVPTLPPEPDAQVVDKLKQALAKEPDADHVWHMLADAGVERPARHQ